MGPRLDVDLMLPVQFHPAQRYSLPERRLLLAVYESALHDLRTPCSPNRSGPDGKRLRARLRDEALEWFAHDGVEPYSFRFCCDQLGMDPGAVRRAITADLPASYHTHTQWSDKRTQMKIRLKTRRRATA